MLSYRHAFHAGNHADVLKHFVLVELLNYYRQKDKPWTYIDTHAGAGCYALGSEVAAKTGEFTDGIGRLWEREDLPAIVQDYVAAVRQFNPSGRLVFYPGSPALAMTLARAQDSLRLFELHPADLRALQQTFGKEARVKINGADGYSGLKSLLPPPSRRAVVLIDPPYEVKDDYRRVLEVLAEAMQRFPTGCYALWYPLLDRAESRRLPERLAGLEAGSWLDVRLMTRHPPAEGLGLYGSGLYLINPPWVLPERLEKVLPWLTEVLGIDEGAGFELDYQIE
ncbi:ribosomal RNA large subunit methyltransferase J [Betaproteobacteria bacterium]|nr:ribosomal RNA large subunit methyltransferase J [Betaproteobacteria bacterium]